MIGLLAILLFSTCQNGAKETKILLEPNTEGSLSLGTPKHIIKLEMTPESALGNISKVQTDFDKDRIFVLSDFNIYIFNSVESSSRLESKINRTSQELIH